jgi:Spy/CpxP family protein refolding chaperone
MKRMILSAAIVLVALANTFGQQRQDSVGRPAYVHMTAEQRAELHTLRMVRDLNLTTEQQQKVYEAHLQSEQAVEKADRKADTATKRESLRQIRQQRDRQIMQVLNKNQRQRLEQRNASRSEPSTRSTQGR